MKIPAEAKTKPRALAPACSITGLTTIPRGLIVFLALWVVALTGCLGPPLMQHDIDAYNQATVESETDMLLYNIGRLHDNQPPHFTMLSSVSQSRSFSASAGFSWSQALSALNPVTLIAHAVSPSKTITTTSSNIATGSTWQAGPFATGTVENPTITFVPIQGQDFANRFETPLRDKFTYFLEDREWFSTAAEKEAMVLLFAQSLFLPHGDNDKCQAGLYVNRSVGQRDLHSVPPHKTYDYSDLSACVKEIVEQPNLYSVLIDGHHPVPTKGSADPSATDVTTALAANYEWTQKGKDYKLTTPIRIPAWLDYNPDFDEHAQPEDLSLDPVLIHQDSPPKAVDLVYRTPKGYTWKQYTDEEDRLSYALVPEGYTIRDGELKKLDKCGAVECELGTCEGGKCSQEGKCVGDKCKAKECESGTCEGDQTKLLYSDEIVDGVWPVPQDYFYIELRKNYDPEHLPKDDDPEHRGIPPVYNTTAEKVCFGRPDADEKNNDVVCGYLKIGNLLQIMQRLATLVCTPAKNNGRCDDENIFAVGPRSSVPAWAERKTQIGTNQYIWEPAHDPKTDLSGVKDQQMFSYLYKLYQMSLVDTSKLVTGAPPITISK